MNYNNDYYINEYFIRMICNTYRIPDNNLICKININYIDNYLFTPLIYACIYNKSNIVKYLLNNDIIQINYKNDNLSALNYSIKNIDCLKLLLLDLRTDLNVLNNNDIINIVKSIHCIKIILTTEEYNFILYRLNNKDMSNSLSLTKKFNILLIDSQPLKIKKIKKNNYELKN